MRLPWLLLAASAALNVFFIGGAAYYMIAAERLAGDPQARIDFVALEPAVIVATSMSNLGLETALKPLGIGLLRCDVGDRTVVSTMQQRGVRLGGEQSGHLVDLSTSTTGDGLSTALRLTAILQIEGRPLSELLAGFRRFPQVLQNVEVTSKPDLESLPEVATVAREVEKTLGDQGRLVLRYSGTEPLARVMIEGPELAQIEELSQRLIEAIRATVGATPPERGTEQ